MTIAFCLGQIDNGLVGRIMIRAFEIKRIVDKENDVFVFSKHDPDPVELFVNFNMEIQGWRGRMQPITFQNITSVLSHL